MKKNVILLCIAPFLVMTTAFAGKDYEPVFLVHLENDTIMMNDSKESTQDETNTHRMNITIGDKVLTATLADNSSVEALIDALTEGPITVDMRDYGNMEKVGSLGRDFPRNDESITAEPGDIILFQGSALVIYYAPNSWRFTRLGKIDNVNQQELKAILGEGGVTVTLSLPRR